MSYRANQKFVRFRGRIWYKWYTARVISIDRSICAS